MDETFEPMELNLEDFIKSDCPVKIGDRFYRNYHVPNTLNYAIVEDIEERKDENGTFYVVTGRFVNMAVGVNVKKFDSRLLTNGSYTILKKGIDF